MPRPLSLLAVTLTVACHAAQAQAPPEGAFVSIHRVRLAPGRDGEIIVTEALRVDMPAGRHGLARRLRRVTPLGRRVRIDIIAVTNGTLWQTGHPLRYAVAKTEGTITLDIGDPIDFLPPGPDQYRLDYRVRGAIESTRDGDRFMLELGDFDVPARPCGYWVAPPPGLAPADLRWQLFRVGRAVTGGLETQLHPEALLIRDDEHQPEPPLLEAYASERVEIVWASRGTIGPDVGSVLADARPLVATLVLPLAALVLWARVIRRRRGRLAVAAGLAGGDLPPAVAVGALLAGRIGPRDHAAATLELATAGVLDPGTSAQGRPAIARGSAPIGAGPLAAYEAALVAALCPAARAEPVGPARARLAQASNSLTRLAGRALDNLELLAHPLPPRSGALALALAQTSLALALTLHLASGGDGPRAATALAVTLAGAAWALGATRGGATPHALAAAAMAAAGWLSEPYQIVSQELPLALQLAAGSAATSGAIAHLRRRPAGEWCGRLGWAALGRLGELGHALDAGELPPADGRTSALALALDREGPPITDDQTGARISAAERFARALLDERTTT